MRHRIAREMALREVNARRELLVKRGELTKKVFARAAEKLLAFTKTEEYPRFLEAQAKKLAPLFPALGTADPPAAGGSGIFPPFRSRFGDSVQLRRRRFHPEQADFMQKIRRSESLWTFPLTRSYRNKSHGLKKIPELPSSDRHRFRSIGDV